MTSYTIRRQLRNLHRLLTAGRAGYEVASQRMKNPGIRGLLFSLSSGRLLMIAQLEQELERLKAMGPLRRSARLRGTIQRRWLEACAVLTAPGDSAVLRECERGEWYLVQQLRATLQLPGLRPVTRDMLMRMEQDVSNTLDDIIFLEGGQFSLA
ncbi:MAG: DUF2383 domain-containing protein [Flavobacteriales bacterium]